MHSYVSKSITRLINECMEFIMKKPKNNFKESLFQDKIIRVPLWKSFVGLPVPVLFFLGVTTISDGLFDTHLWKPNLGMSGVIMGIVFLVISILLVHRIIKYPGIIFTKDTLIIPPVKFHHWKNIIIPYDKITSINSSKHQVFVYCGDKEITIKKHNSTNNLWSEFMYELHSRHERVLKAMRKYEKAKELY